MLSGDWSTHHCEVGRADSEVVRGEGDLTEKSAGRPRGHCYGSSLGFDCNLEACTGPAGSPPERVPSPQFHCFTVSLFLGTGVTFGTQACMTCADPGGRQAKNPV